MFLLLGPAGKAPQYHEIGRSIATLMTDEVRNTPLDVKHTMRIKKDSLTVFGDFKVYFMGLSLIVFSSMLSVICRFE